MAFQTVLDVGAHEGESAEQFHRLFPTAIVHSFEPIPACLEVLKHSFGRHPNQVIHPFALGENETSQSIHVSAYSASSSLLPMAAHKQAYPFSAEANEVSIEVKTLDGVSMSQDWRTPILLKIDTQGYEMQVLRGGVSTLGLAKLVIIETSFVELYANQPLFAEVYHHLTAHGFRYVGSWDQFFDPRNGRPLQQDALFLRD